MAELFWVVVFVYALSKAVEKAKKEYRGVRDHHAANLAREHRDWHPARIKRQAALRAQAHWWNQITHHTGGRWQPFPAFRAAFGESRLRAKAEAAEAHAEGVTSRHELRQRIAAAQARAEAARAASQGAPGPAPAAPPETASGGVPPLPSETAGGLPPEMPAESASPEPSHWLRPGERPCPQCSGSGRNPAGNDACPWCRGWGSDDPDPNAPAAPAGTICGACGRPGTGDDPVLADGPSNIHRSHALEAAANRRQEGAPDPNARWDDPLPGDPHEPGDPFPEPDPDDWPTGQTRHDQHGPRAAAAAGNGDARPLAAVPDHTAPSPTEGPAMTTTADHDHTLEDADTPHEAMQNVFQRFSDQAGRTAAAANDDLAAAAAAHGYDRDPQVMSDIADIADQAAALQARAAQARTGLQQRHAEGEEYHSTGQDAHASAFRPG